jgi:RNAse (barnase) inhibitor barstar
MAKPEFVIDGEDFSTLEEFYEVVGRTLIPGATWGHNLNAFNDILRSGFGTPPDGFVLRWKHARLSSDRLGHEETARQLGLQLARCHPASRAQVADDQRRAAMGMGPTVYDWLVEIIQRHGPGGRESQDGVDLVLD